MTPVIADCARRSVKNAGFPLSRKRHLQWVMPVFTKQWDAPKEPRDGTRILVCRYRPRGLRKEDETWDAWMPQLGPSVELHAAAYGKNREQIPWNSYRVAYLREMRAAADDIDALAKRIAAGETITLLCSSACVRESRCHRSLLKELIERRLSPTSPSAAGPTPC